MADSFSPSTIPNKVSVKNSSTTPLGSNAQFVGEWEDVLDCSGITVLVSTDVLGPADGWKIEWSTDGINVDERDILTLAQTNGQHIALTVTARYFRVTYLNSSTPQSYFRLQTLLSYLFVKNPAHPVIATINDNDTAETVKSVITGKTPSGLYKNVSVDDEGRILSSGVSDLLSPLPAFVARDSKVLQGSASVFRSFNITQDIALVDFHFGGRGSGQASLFRVNTADQLQLPGGGFNSSGDVSMWTNAGAGSSAALTWTYQTARFVEGTGSASLTFTQSDSNNFPAIRYTWSTPVDLSLWRYLIANVYVTQATGGNQSRQTNIILTDVNGATRTWTLSGNTHNSPVYPQNQWNTMIAELAEPNAQTGTFDSYNVSSVTLRLLDGGNKSGTIYWDDIRLSSSLELLERIYISANDTVQLQLNPAELFDTGEVLGVQYINNDTVAREFTVTAKGVER